MRPNKTQWLNLLAVAVLVAILTIVASGFLNQLSAKSEETYKGLKIFSDVIELVEKNYVDPVDTKDLIEKAIQGMVHSLDPHSSLLVPEALKELQFDTQGEFTGIGISITMRDGFVTVISPIEGTPAYRAGIKAGDRIVKVDGEATTDLQEAVKKMRGPKGTEVVVTIVRKGVENTIDFKLIRDVIPIESVRSLALTADYGYVWITNFRENTTEDLEKALQTFEAGPVPMKGLILDLRDNPGGLLDQAIKVADLFLEKGKILSIEGRHKSNTKIFEAEPNSVKRKYPIVVLINDGSASASEIVAGALQDQKRALILGTTSFGKGSVQTVEELRDGYGLKLTIARYYTPSGRSIQAKGIEPDIFLKHRLIDPKELAEDKEMPKEKDLKNHLEAEPGKDTAKPAEPQEKSPQKEKPIAHPPESRFGQLDQDRLKTDNQVIRALEILKGYEIFKTLKN